MMDFINFFWSFPIKCQSSRIRWSSGSKKLLEDNTEFLCLQLPYGHNPSGFMIEGISQELMISILNLENIILSL